MIYGVAQAGLKPKHQAMTAVGPITLPCPECKVIIDIDAAQAGLKPKPKIGIWHAGGAAKDTGYLRERAFDRGAMSTTTEAILKVLLFHLSRHLQLNIRQ